MKKLISLIIIILSFTNCSKNDDENSNPIVGEWKLIKTEIHSWDVNNVVVTDYSTQNIIYKFETNSNLNINTNGDKSVNYNYEYKYDYLSESPISGDTKGPLVIIDNIKYTYVLNNGIMILGQSYIDGADFYFEKK